MRKLVRALSNSIGWSTKRRIVVIESDDWGSIRMPSNTARERLEKLGVDLNSGAESYRYSKYDTLASDSDMEALYSSLAKVKDQSGRSPVFTAIALSANPDFEKISADNYSMYHYESIESTFAKYNLNTTLDLWKEGEANRLFVPEFHGREHINVPAWIRQLQAGNKHVIEAFNYGMWAISIPDQRIDFQAAYDLELWEDLPVHHETIRSGLQLFEKVFSRKATYFVPPNGPFNNQLFATAKEGGIELISSAKLQKEVFGSGKTKLRFHWLGKQNGQKQITITRNCFFEPSDPTKDWVRTCLSEVELAFQYNKPAVISSHRVNYIGGLSEENRVKGLSELSSLLNSVVKKYPDVEFMTSVELGNLMLESKS